MKYQLKRLTALTLSLLMVLSLFSANVFAADGEKIIEKADVPATMSLVKSGSCGDNVKWSFDSSGVLTISGKGAMSNYTAEEFEEDDMVYIYCDAPWFVDYSDRITSIVVENGVTSIGDYAFILCEKLTSVSVANSVTSIGEGAFTYCESLNKINIPQGLTNISKCAFSDCVSLTDISLPDSLTNLGEGVFMFSGITNVNIPESISEIKELTFFYCPYLTNITIPDSITMIGEGAFAITGLTEITIPASVSNIMDGAFMSNYELSSVTFLGDAPTIGEDCFLEVETTVCYPYGNETWSANVRQNYGGELTWVPVATAGIIKGDVDFDGYLTTSDLVIIARYVIDLVPFTEQQISIADADEDGIITTTDLVQLARDIVNS